jgi:enediyne biosynthesis protein E4
MRTNAWSAPTALMHLLAFTFSFFTAVNSAFAAEESVDRAAILNRLDERRKLQIANARKFKAFYGFNYSDRVLESNIQFHHRAVDDAGKSYKAAHYDHGNGLAVADVDGDGLLDLYFTTQLGKNQLWRNSGGGKFEDITSSSGVAMENQISVTASFADIDNDSDPDLFVTTVRHGNRLFENLGSGRFREISEEAGVGYVGHSSGAVFFDFNNDGLLDLFVVNVGTYTTDQQGVGGYYLAQTNAFSGHLFPERTEFSILYQNMGRNKFTDVSKQMNLRDGSWTGDATFVDLNKDRYPDLYLVNMQGDDHFYENQAGRKFVEKTAAYFPKTPWGAMGIKSFDFNNDGLMDLFVTDMHSDMTKDHTVRALSYELGMEKTKSEAFCATQWTEAYLQGSTNNLFGNSFFQNLGNGSFKESSDPLGVETYWPWGISVGDLNADGFDDIFITAGMGYPFRYAINSVLLNEGGKHFFDSEFLLGVEPRAQSRTEKPWFNVDCDGADSQHPECAGKTGRVDVYGTLSSRSSAIFDLDNDGDLDIVTNEFNDRPQVLISDVSQRRPIRFLMIRLVGKRSNRDGLGALVTVRTGAKTLMQFADGKSGYLSQSSMPLYFGLGEAEKIDEIKIGWPSGTQQTVKDVKIKLNRLLWITEE